MESAADGVTIGIGGITMVGTNDVAIHGTVLGSSVGFVVSFVLTDGVFVEELERLPDADVVGTEEGLAEILSYCSIGRTSLGYRAKTGTNEGVTDARFVGCRLGLDEAYSTGSVIELLLG